MGEVIADGVATGWHSHITVWWQFCQRGVWCCLSTVEMDELQWQQILFIYFVLGGGVGDQLTGARVRICGQGRIEERASNSHRACIDGEMLFLLHWANTNWQTTKPYWPFRLRKLLSIVTASISPSIQALWELHALFSSIRPWRGVKALHDTHPKWAQQFEDYSQLLKTDMKVSIQTAAV